MHNSIVHRSNPCIVARSPLADDPESEEPAGAPARFEEPTATLVCEWFEEVAPTGKVRLRCRWVAR